MTTARLRRSTWLLWMLASCATTKGAGPEAAASDHDAAIVTIAGQLSAHDGGPLVDLE